MSLGHAVSGCGKQGDRPAEKLPIIEQVTQGLLLSVKNRLAPALDK
jgi:hypothetical protein